MNYIIINIKNTLMIPTIVLSKGAGDRLSLKQGDTEIYLDTIDTASESVLTGMGSSLANVIFLFGSEFQIDSALRANTQIGLFRFKEAEQIVSLDSAKTILGADAVTSFYFNDTKTAKRFVEKKIFGEIYLLNTEERNVFPFYTHLREAYLFASHSVEAGFMSFLDTGNTLSAPSATITELPLDFTHIKSMNLDDTNAVFELPIWKRYKLDFTPASGMNVIRMIRGKRSIKDGNGNLFWEIHDEIFKIYVG